MRLGRLQLDANRRELKVDGVVAKLGARAFDVLLILVEKRHQMVSKDELLDLVWPNQVVEENTLQVHISALRKLLGPQAITTIPGRGYCFTAQAPSSVRAPVAMPTPSGVNETLLSPTRPPAALPQLFGRDDDVKAVCALSLDNPIVSVVGAGGIGKTTLVLAAAEALRTSFADGVSWVELASVSDPHAVAGTVAQTLQVAVPSKESADALLASVLKQQNVLLVLDNCEHVIDAAARLAEALVRKCPGLRVLVTSQETLHLPQEQVYRLEGLAVPSRQEPARADHAAIALFMARARGADRRIHFDDASLPIVAAICRALDGIPLAIELAAARVPLLGIEGLHRRLEQRFQLLTGGARTVLPRHQTLRAALEWSYSLLTDAEQIILQRLGIFAGGFPLELAQAVASDDCVDQWTVLDILGHLIDKSLVVAETTEVPRYRLLETTRAFALEKLAAAGATTTRQRAHAHALHDYLLPLHVRYWTVSNADYARARAELDNVRAALDWAESSANDGLLAYALLGVSQLTWHANGQLLEGIARCQRLMPVPNDLPPELDARVHLVYGRLGFLTSRADCFLAAGRAARLFRDLDDRDALADSLIARAMIGSRRAEREDVSAAIREAETLVTEASPPRQRAALALAQAMWHAMCDRLDQAVAAAQRQAACYREDHDEFRVQLALQTAAQYECARGHYESSIERLQAVLGELRRLRAPHGTGQTLGYLALALTMRNAPGDCAQAMAHARNAWSELQREGNAGWLIAAIALTLARQGSVDKAARLIGHVQQVWAQEAHVPWPFRARLRDETLKLVSAAVGDQRAAALIAEGVALGDDAAATLAFDLE